MVDIHTIGQIATYVAFSGIGLYTVIEGVNSTRVDLTDAIYDKSTKIGFTRKEIKKSRKKAVKKIKSTQLFNTVSKTS
ncbi:MAG: hypothetical protein GOV02_04145 [Candidatus Aenigmarchaeota archaeon]|nr:hypothetical protein [Candidatus Aenigmarchaeota archaeon]